MFRNLWLSIMVLGLWACGEKHPSHQKESLSQPIQATPSATPLLADTMTKNDPKVTAEALKQQCCQQCASASNMDPTGADISMKSCLAYAGMLVNGSAPLSTNCVEYFEGVNLKVMDCR